MKKLIASILFFGSFSVVMAQISSNDLPQVSAGIDPYYIWRTPAPSCGSTKVPWTTVKSTHCESPWSHTTPNPIPLNEEYIFPSGVISPTYRAFLKTHTGILFTDPTKSSCNSFSASKTLCNSATLKGKKKSGLGASLYSAWHTFLDTRTVNPQTIIQGVSQAIGVVDGYEFTRGCEWYEKRVDTMKTIKNKCPIANMCTIVNVRMMTYQMQIKQLTAQLGGAQTDEMRAKIQSEIDRSKAGLSEVEASCSQKMCILNPAPVDAAGLPAGYSTCIEKKPCPCGAATNEGMPSCAPNPYCRVLKPQ